MTGRTVVCHHHYYFYYWSCYSDTSCCCLPLLLLLIELLLLVLLVLSCDGCILASECDSPVIRLQRVYTGIDNCLDGCRDSWLDTASLASA